MSDTALTGLPLARLHRFVLRPGDLVDVDGVLQDDGGTLLLLPLGGDDGPKKGEPVGAGVPVQVPVDSTVAAADVVTVRGTWTGSAIVVTSVQETPSPRTLRRLTRTRARGPRLPRPPANEGRAAMEFLVSDEVADHLLIAFGGEVQEDGSDLELAWFTRLTAPVADRLVDVPPEQFAVDVWLVPARPS